MGRYTTGSKTLEWARDQGWLTWKVEHYNNWARKKYDLFHIIDYLAITKNRTIGVQSCGADFAAHITKMLVEERQHTFNWLQDPNRELVLIGWRKVKKKRGGKQMIWQPRILWFSHNGKKFILSEKSIA